MVGVSPETFLLLLLHKAPPNEHPNPNGPIVVSVKPLSHVLQTAACQKSMLCTVARAQSLHEHVWRRERHNDMGWSCKDSQDLQVSTAEETGRGWLWWVERLLTSHSTSISGKGSWPTVFATRNSCMRCILIAASLQYC
jgi:hypothetical protein